MTPRFQPLFSGDLVPLVYVAVAYVVTFVIVLLLCLVWRDTQCPKYLVVKLPDAKDSYPWPARSVEVWAYVPFGDIERMGVLRTESLGAVVSLLEAPMGNGERRVDIALARADWPGVWCQVPRSSRKALWRLLRDEQRREVQGESRARQVRVREREQSAEATAAANRTTTLASLRTVVNRGQGAR